MTTSRAACTHTPGRRSRPSDRHGARPALSHGGGKRSFSGPLVAATRTPRLGVALTWHMRPGATLLIRLLLGSHRSLDSCVI